MMRIWHLRFSSDGRHALFRLERVRRLAIHVVVKHIRKWVICFGIVDDHLHVVVLCSRERAGKISRAVVLGLRPLAGLEFEPSYIKPVESRAHLLRLVGYCIEQPVKHGLDVHPALWSGSCFSDIVGARVIDGLELRLGEVLPRYRAADAWRSAGLPAAGIAPMSDAAIFGAGLPALVAASAFAAGAPDELERRTRVETQARAAAVVLGRQAGFRVGDLARAMGVSPESVRKLGSHPIDERVLHAVRLRMGIEAQLGGRSGRSRG